MFFVWRIRTKFCKNDKILMILIGYFLIKSMDLAKARTRTNMKIVRRIVEKGSIEALFAVDTPNEMWQV
ncbi:hypothetical protein CWO92_08355 [Heyndrickxia camelliae]|uniref:Uncharacterized protein n=1 Tax=Heyndrickxia camelliae TaxID=1707093 RepID=A0A2N3LMD4_9BACI|nr:hypothetical protein CWO92_08355 [Heyndrickxia camelliae]